MMDGKLLLFFLLFLCAFLQLHAQNSYHENEQDRSFHKKRWMIEATGGINIDLISSNPNPDLIFLKARPTVAPSFNYKVTHLFSKKIGWYADFRINFYGERRKANFYEPGFGESFIELLSDIAEIIAAPILALHPSLDAGLVYRIEKKRFGIYPQVGIGYTAYLSEVDKTRSKTKNGKEYTTEYKRRATPLSVNAGLAANYALSKNVYLVLNTNYHQPIQKSYGELAYFVDGVETGRERHKVKSAGRTLNITIGGGVCF